MNGKTRLSKRFDAYASKSQHVSITICMRFSSTSASKRRRAEMSLCHHANGRMSNLPLQTCRRNSGYQKTRGEAAHPIAGADFIVALGRSCACDLALRRRSQSPLRLLSRILHGGCLAVPESAFGLLRGSIAVLASDP